jgi:hypothetical protein
MNIFTSAFPQWVSIAFIMAILIPIFVLGRMTYIGALNANLDAPKKYQIYIQGFLILFFSYASLMSFTGIFQQTVMPPRIFLFTTIPLLIFYNIVSRKSSIWKNIIENIPLASLIRFHIIRFIGVFFLIAYSYGALPRYFALSAGIGDIIAAISAIFVANYAEKSKPHFKKIVFIWNCIGLLDIINVIIAGFYISKLSIENGTQGVLEMTYFPLCLIPAFAPATIIFLHIHIFKKLKKIKE